jgi:hypothetical protein
MLARRDLPLLVLAQGESRAAWCRGRALPMQDAVSVDRHGVSAARPLRSCRRAHAGRSPLGESDSASGDWYRPSTAGSGRALCRLSTSRSRVARAQETIVPGGRREGETGLAPAGSSDRTPLAARVRSRARRGSGCQACVTSAAFWAMGEVAACQAVGQRRDRRAVAGRQAGPGS